MAKYAGTDKVDLIENEEYGYCSLIKATKNVLDKLKIENITLTKVTSTTRIEKNLADPVALREAVINAIVHNDFTREIPPVFEICVFKDVGLVEQLGSGMSRILKVYRKDIFEISEYFIKVVFPIADVQGKHIIDNGDINGDINGNIKGYTEKVFNLLCQKRDITSKEMGAVLGFSTRKISRIMKELKDKGKITRIGSNKTGHWKINE